MYRLALSRSVQVDNVDEGWAVLLECECVLKQIIGIYPALCVVSLKEPYTLSVQNVHCRNDFHFLLLTQFQFAEVAKKPESNWP